MDKRKEITGHLLAAVATFVWGTTFISTKVLLRYISPVEILFIRFTIGFLVLLAMYPHRLKVGKKKQELYFAAAGLSGITLYFLLENIALTCTYASNVGVIVSAAPFFTAIFAHLFLDGEKLRFSFFIGFLVAVLGIYLISFNGSNVLKLNPTGDLLAVLAAAVWAVYSVLLRKISAFHYHAIQTTRRVFFYGLVFMIPALFIFDFKPHFELLIEPIVVFNMLFLGVGASALCFVAWSSAVNTLGAVKTSIYIYLVPVITVVTSVIILNEKITIIAAIGTALTLAGLFISERRTFVQRQKEI
jgi:drug/metabolite transporter (DMT)-like permease